LDPAEPEEITALRRSIHQMIQREVPRERIQAWDAQGSITREEGHRISKMLADLGLFGLCIPEEYGGSGWHVRALGMAEVELVKCSMVLSTILCMGSLWGALLIAETGTDAQKQKLLPGLLAGETLFSFAMTEPDVGGDLASVTTRAERRGDKIVINGRKRFITGAAICDYMYTLVRTGPREDRQKNLSLVIIPSQTAGISISLFGRWDPTEC